MARSVKKRESTRVSSKHQVTIPVRALAAAGLRPGDTLIVEAAGPGRVVLSNLEAELDRYDGCLAADDLPGDLVEQLRAEWE